MDESKVTNVASECILVSSEATPKKDTNENGLLDSEASSKEIVEKEANSLNVLIPDEASFGAVSIDLMNTEDPVTSTNTLVNGRVDSKTEIKMISTTKKINDDLRINEQESAENEISSSTGEKLNGKMNGNEKVNGVGCCENEETCSSDASAENNVGAKTNNGNGVEFYCKRCSKESLYPCFGCGKETEDKTKETLRYTCYVGE